MSFWRTPHVELKYVPLSGGNAGEFMDSKDYSIQAYAENRPGSADKL